MTERRRAAEALLNARGERLSSGQQWTASTVFWYAIFKVKLLKLFLIFLLKLPFDKGLLLRAVFVGLISLANLLTEKHNYFARTFVLRTILIDRNITDGVGTVITSSVGASSLTFQGC